MGQWYARPVLSVADIQRAVDFYVDKLGFTMSWRFDVVAQVARDDCEIILNTRRPVADGPAMLFLELTEEDYRALPGSLTANGVAFEDGWWGYRSVIVEDPDGNRLYFGDPTDTGDDDSSVA